MNTGKIAIGHAKSQIAKRKFDMRKAKSQMRQLSVTEKSICSHACTDFPYFLLQASKQASKQAR